MTGFGLRVAAFAAMTTIFVCLRADISSAQTLTREYIRLNGSVIAVESPSALPVLVGVNPLSGSGPGATFTGTFDDAAGAAQIYAAHFWFTPASGGSCHIGYYPSANMFYLDSSSADWSWTGGNGVAGSSNTLSNGVCSLALASSSGSANGTTLTVSVNVTFDVYATYTSELLAQNTAGVSVGWQSFGSWTAQASGGSGGPIGAGSMGGSLAGKPAVAMNSGGRLEVVAWWSNNSLGDVSQSTANGNWNGWTFPGGYTIANAAFAANSDGRLQAFVVGGDNAVWTIEQSTAGGTLSGWSSLGGSINGDPVIGANADGTLEIFAVGTDGTLYHNKQNSPDGSWSGFSSLGGSWAGLPAVARNQDGSLEVFLRGNDSALYHAWQQTAGGNWSSFQSLGGYISSNPAVAVNQDGRVEAFALASNALWHIAQSSAGGSWGSWNSAGGVANGDPAVALDGNGQIEAFVRGPDNALWQASQVTAGSSSWSGWSSLQGSMADVARPILNSNNELQVFYRASDNTLRFVTQSSPGVWPSGPYANFQICNTTNCYTSGVTFNVNDWWTIVITSNIPNASFTLTSTFNGTPSSAPNWGTTDSEGSWSQSGQMQQASVGSWTEQIIFPQATSNTISFTVQN